jgi:hypothetical protein
MARSRFERLALIGGAWLAITSASFAAPPLLQPSWAELTPEQQVTLAPLAGEWANLDGFRRKKWLGIAQRYKSMTPDEQNRIKERMSHWVKLSPEERKQAREKYLALKKAHPEQKDVVKQKWQKYEELPASEKERLKADAKSKPVPRPGAVKPQLTTVKAAQASPLSSPAKPVTPAP